ncbi:hypothetical protein PAXRUDRAFT_829525 [Paxillus rubicundulus Ve08.2h10]|uniref:Uncharacterized protein n=1 Tax=Paxillus rubicundulus Ve08.2h10 TaxID=930991 RepID=A0A0D0DMM5_9AGAM|nr:hypothetical protein PAXRUDRAFT_829525 [Paxillus rubicundulus Ve08.2h10]
MPKAWWLQSSRCIFSSPTTMFSQYCRLFRSGHDFLSHCMALSTTLPLPIADLADN